MTEKVRATWSALWSWIAGLVKGLLSVLDVLVDYVYDRMDLWHNKNARIADHGKVRSFFLYTTVMMVYVGISIGFDVFTQHGDVGGGKTTKEVPTVYLLYMGMAMLALSSGERTLIAFFKAWGSRTQPDPTGSLKIITAPRNTRDGVDLSPEPPNSRSPEE